MRGCKLPLFKFSELILSSPSLLIKAGFLAAYSRHFMPIQDGYDINGIIVLCPEGHVKNDVPVLGSVRLISKRFIVIMVLNPGLLIMPRQVL